MKYEYIMQSERYPGDAIGFDSEWDSGKIYHNLYIAEDVGELLWNQDVNTEFPVDIEIFKDGESLGEFTVRLKMCPTFQAEVS